MEGGRAGKQAGSGAALTGRAQVADGHRGDPLVPLHPVRWLLPAPPPTPGPPDIRLSYGKAPPSQALSPRRSPSGAMYSSVCGAGRAGGDGKQQRARVSMGESPCRRVTMPPNRRSASPDIAAATAATTRPPNTTLSYPTRNPRTACPAPPDLTPPPLHPHPTPAHPGARDGPLVPQVDGQAEVAQLEGHVAREQDVLRLQVAVQNALGGRGGGCGLAECR